MSLSIRKYSIILTVLRIITAPRPAQRPTRMLKIMTNLVSLIWFLRHTRNFASGLIFDIFRLSDFMSSLEPAFISKRKDRIKYQKLSFFTY